MKRAILFIIIILLSGCKKATTPDNPPTISSFQPSETGLDMHIGDVIEFLIKASDADEDDFEYQFRMNNVFISNNNAFSWTVDEKGITNIMGIAYNDLADTTEWTVIVENRAPQAVNLILDMNEDVSKSIAKESLGIDPDGDNVSYRFLSGDHATFELEVGNITFRNEADYFGSAYVEFEISDGELADTGRVDLNIAPINDAPRIEQLADTSGNEDEIPVGMIVQDLNGKVTDVDGDTFTLELEQTNPDLIRLAFNEDSSKIIVDYLQPDGNGSAEITIKVTDSNGSMVETSFDYLIQPMTDIEGTILDTDTQEANASLDAWVEVNGVRILADEHGNYSVQVEPTHEFEIQAGYTENGEPMSYVPIYKNINASNDTTGLDLAVTTYKNLGVTPKEFYLLMEEGSARNGKLRCLRKDMSWNIYKTGRYGETYNEEEIDSLVSVAEYINLKLVRPIPIIVDSTGWFPTTIAEATGKIIVEKWSSGGRGGIALNDESDPKDGRIDIVEITVRVPIEFNGSTREEFASAVGLFNPTYNTLLSGGKTISWEHEGINQITEADIKVFRFVQNMTDNVGGLKPYMPIDDILKLQE